MATSKLYQQLLRRKLTEKRKPRTMKKSVGILAIQPIYLSRYMDPPRFSADQLETLKERVKHEGYDWALEAYKKTHDGKTVSKEEFQRIFGGRGFWTKDARPVTG